MIFVRETFLLVVGLGVILAGAELFTNAVEWLGRRLGLGEGAVGSILAAVGTAMPETLVPVVALLSTGDGHAPEVGLGAILGAPLMLATLGLAVSGAAVWVLARAGRRRPEISASASVLRRDLGFFLLIYVAVGVAGLVSPRGIAAYVGAALLVGAYGYYVARTLRCRAAAGAGSAKGVGEGGEGGGEGAGEGAATAADPPALFLSRAWAAARRAGPSAGRSPLPPSLPAVAAQLALALAVIILGGHGFVRGVIFVSGALGVSTFVLAVIITPIATELPEKFNSIIWLSQGKDTLALGNITGAMVFQGSLLPALGLLLTPWTFGRMEILAAGATLVSAGAVYLQVRRSGRVTAGGLGRGALIYAAFVALVVAAGSGIPG